MPGSLRASNSTRGIIDKYNLSKSHANLTTYFNEEEAQNNYSILDYFGFYHPDGLTHRDKEIEHKYRKKDVKRVGKWMKFIQSNGFNSFYKGHPNEELIRRVFKGIPPPIRPRVWPILLNVASAKRDRVYEDMRKYAFASSTYIEQIDLDINRTFRSTTFFNEAFGPRQQVLFRILAAYSVYNTEVGYCQGMSDIAGMLLIYIMDEEEAFWALAQLLDGPRHKMHCLFVRDFPGLKRYFAHHDRVLRTHLRKVWKHFRKEQVDCCTYAFKWYMQCFLGRLPISLTLRIWDIYLLEGEKALVAMAYNILKMHKQRLLRMDQMQILAFLQDEICRDFGFDDDDVIDSLKDCLEDLRRANMETPPPLTPDMLPTKPMGLVPAVWEVRHSDDEENAKVDSSLKQHQKQKNRRSKDEEQVTNSTAVVTVALETDGILRSDELRTATAMTPSGSFKMGLEKSSARARKPPSGLNLDGTVTSRNQQHLNSPLISQNSPVSTDSRRRLRGSYLSMNSSGSNLSFSHMSTDMGSTASNYREHHSLPKYNPSRGKRHSRVSAAPTSSTPQSHRRISNGKVNNLLEDNGTDENVWFIPSGTGYTSSQLTKIDDQRKQKTPNQDMDLPPRDYNIVTEAGAVKLTEDNDPNSPWTLTKIPVQPKVVKTITIRNKTISSKITKEIVRPPSADNSTERSDSSPLWTKRAPPSAQLTVYTNSKNPDVYVAHVQRPTIGYNGVNSYGSDEGDTRWRIPAGTVAASSPPQICSPLYTLPPRP